MSSSAHRLVAHAARPKASHLAAAALVLAVPYLEQKARKWRCGRLPWDPVR